MSTEETKAPAADAREVAIETASKEQIYEELGQFVQDLTGKRIGKTGGRKVFDAVVSRIFEHATRNKVFRFNAGFGSLHVRNYGAGSRRLPSGAVTEFGERSKLRYEEGVVVEALIQNGGNLAAVLAARKVAPEGTALAAEAVTTTAETASLD